MTNYKPIYIDLQSGNKFYLDSPAGISIKIFKFHQTTPTSSWAITHNENTTNFIIMVNDNVQIGIKDISVIDSNNLQIDFNYSATGDATLILFD